MTILRSRNRLRPHKSTSRPSRIAILLCAWLSAPTDLVAQRTRAYAPTRWVLMWSNGGGENDATFGSVREHVTTDSVTYVLDAGTLQVHAIELKTSKLLWSIGRRGSGPGELRMPVDIALTRTGFAVLDQGNGRIALFGFDGAHVRDISGETMANAISFCSLSDGSFVVQQSRKERYLVRYAGDGRIMNTWAFPWPTKADNASMLLSTSAIRGIPGAECHFVPTFGFGVVHVGLDGRLRTTKLFEQYPIPEFRLTVGTNGMPRTLLERGHNASLGGMHWSDTIGVNAMSARGGYVGLDLYDRQTGRYLATWRLPPDDRLTRSSGVMIGIASSNITQSVRAWADTSDTTRVFKSWGVKRKPVTTGSKSAPPTPPRPNTLARPSAPARVPPPASR